MGTTVEAWLEPKMDIDALVTWFELVENECSRFRPDSALSKLNNTFEATVRVGGILGEVLNSAQEAFNLSAGLVDAAAGSALVAGGYAKSFGEGLEPTDAPRPAVLPRWSYQRGQLERANGTSLDLGATAKGWTCDRAVENGLASVVSAGGDIRSGHDDTVVPILDPWGEIVATLPLGIGALATSSQTKRRWKAGDRTVSHIIDPRTMAPTISPVLSASAIARTAFEAEVAAKVILLQGASGLSWADQTPWVESSLLIWSDGSVYGTSGMRVAI
jgi:thiamine biosynthesis lipoprotein